MNFHLICTTKTSTLYRLWFVVYSVVYTLYHNSPVVRCLYTTSGLWFVVYSVVYTLYHNSPVVRCGGFGFKYFIMFYVLNIFIIKEITLHYLVFWEKTISLMYTAAVYIQQVDCDLWCIMWYIHYITIHLL
jgi:hypothetical protein